MSNSKDQFHQLREAANEAEQATARNWGATAGDYARAYHKEKAERMRLEAIIERISEAVYQTSSIDDFETAVHHALEDYKNNNNQ
jgi:hypothetical protein